MYTIGIWTEKQGWSSWQVDGCEAAWNAYHKACDLCEAVGAGNAAIWDTATTEILADWVDDQQDEGWD